MPQMQAMQPCARCEQELPESFFDAPDSMFCKRCNKDVTDLLRKKYNIIEAAYFRAQLRNSAKKLKRRYGGQSAGAGTAAAGD